MENIIRKSLWKSEDHWAIQANIRFIIITKSLDSWPRVEFGIGSITFVIYSKYLTDTRELRIQSNQSDRKLFKPFRKQNQTRWELKNNNEQNFKWKNFRMTFHRTIPDSNFWWWWVNFFKNSVKLHNFLLNRHASHNGFTLFYKHH